MILESEDPSRPDAVAFKGLLCLLLALLALSLCSNANRASAITQSQVSSVDGSIQSAFLSAHSAEKTGGNVSSIVAQLNAAIALVQKADAENATNPSQASRDLQNATTIAQGVSVSAPSLGRAGSSARQDTDITSIGSAIGVVVLASLAYLFGGRIYRRIWLFAYRDYVVRPSDG